MKFRTWLENWQDDLPERGHDYDPAWDYEVDETPQLVDSVNRIVQDLKANLLPAIRVFRDFDVKYVSGLGGGEMAKYAYGTYSHPIVMLDMAAVQDACEEYGVQCDIGIETSIVHELGHAIQEAYDLPMDEEEAEGLARTWHYERRPTFFWL